MSAGFFKPPWTPERACSGRAQLGARNFLHPGKRIKLAPTDWYALGVHRGGIDERWFASTTEAMNDNRADDEGLSYCVFQGQRFLLRDAVEEGKGKIVGEAIWNEYKRWPVYSKFFDNMGPIPHHMHQQHEHAALTGQQGKPECYYFPPQLNAAENHFDYTFMGLEPGTTKDDVLKCLENWNKGDNGILDLSKAYRLKPGTGWMIPAGVLHAPGSMCTYEPQWGSDVFGMYQSIVEGRQVPWDLLVKDVPKDKHQDLDFIVEQLAWEKNVDPNFKQSNYVEPIVDKAASATVTLTAGSTTAASTASSSSLRQGADDRPRAKMTLRDPGASGWITVQAQRPDGQAGAANAGDDPLRRSRGTRSSSPPKPRPPASNRKHRRRAAVGLRYFGPNVHKSTPQIGDHRKQ